MVFTPTAILFDFDGTLVHSLALWEEAYDFALKSYGINLSNSEIIERCFYKDLDKLAAELQIQDPHELESRLEQGLANAFSHAKLFEGVVPLLQTLQDRGRKIGLVTSSYSTVVEKSLNHLGIRKYFEHTVAGDEVTNRKPHPEPITTVLAKFKVTPEEAFFVGDSHVDVLAGKAAKVKTALFLPEEHRKYHCFDTLRSHGPDYEFSHHEQLLEIIS